MNGTKTYIAAAALAAWGIAGYFAGAHDQAAMIQMLLEAAALAGLRHAIQTK